MASLFPLLLIGVACVGIMYGCNLFELAADHLGRNMQNGVKGATINAVGSSLPELFTTFILLFMSLSIKDALKGNYDDAVANAIGSNIFDVCVSLGLPITIYGLLEGPIDLSETGDDGVRMVRWVMLGFTLVVLGLLLPGKVGKKSGITLFFLYGAWVTYIAYRTVAT